MCFDTTPSRIEHLHGRTPEKQGTEKATRTIHAGIRPCTGLGPKGKRERRKEGRKTRERRKEDKRKEGRKTRERRKKDKRK